VATLGADEWAQQEKIGNMPQGWAINTMVLDLDVGPTSQTQQECSLRDLRPPPREFCAPDSPRPSWR